MKMRSIIFAAVLILMTSSLLFAQNAPVDFEAGGYGADWTWTVFENGSNPPIEIVSNPNASGINTSATVGMFTTLVSGQPWAGCETLDIGEFTFDETNSTISIMVHKDVLSDVTLKFEGVSAPVEIHSINTTTGAWEEIVYDFSGAIGNTYNKLVFFPDFDMEGRTQDNIIYYDNITFSEQIAGNEPQEPAPTPANEPGDVISIFSDSYDDIAGTDFTPWWGQSTIVTFPEINANQMMKYANFNYQGTQFSGAQDLSLMEYVHIDMWTADATVVLFTPISVTTGEVLVSLEPITPNEWNSFDIPLSAFTGLSFADIHQLKFDGQQGVTPSNIYLDNIYFWRNPQNPGNDATLSDLQVDDMTIEGFAPTTLSYDYLLEEGTTVVPTVTAATTDPLAEYDVIDAGMLPGTTEVVVTSANGTVELTYSVNFIFPTPVPETPAPDPQHAAVSVSSIYSDSYDDLEGTDFNPNWGQSTIVTFEDIGGNGMLMYDNFNYQGTALAGSFDMSNMTYLHIDMWTPDATVVMVTPISATTGEYLYSLTPIETAQWNSYDIPLTEFMGVSMADIIQLKFDGQQGVVPSTIYLDNIYFYSSFVPGSDATLADLQVDGDTIEGFSSDILSYEMELPAGTTEVPEVFAVTTDPNATFDIVPPAELPGATEVMVTAEDGQTMLTYSITFTLADAVPEIAAPTPEVDPESVISLYSSAYDDVTVDTWSAEWDMADLEDIQIEGNDTKLYTNLVFAGIEFTSQTIDATFMSHFHMDVWTPDNTSAPAVFKVKLVDFGADGVWGTDDVEHEMILDESVMNSEEWVSLDLSLEDFTGLVTKEHLAQLVISGDPNTVYVDNVYLYNDGSIPVWIYGDITGDDVIDAFDAANILQYSVQLDPIGAPLPWTWQLIAGDVDGNGSVEAYDAALVLQYSVDMLDVFPVEARSGSNPQGMIDIQIDNNEIIIKGLEEVYSLQISTPDLNIFTPDFSTSALHAVNLEDKIIALASAEEMSGILATIPYSNTSNRDGFDFSVSVNGVLNNYNYSADGLVTLSREFNVPIDFEQDGHGANWTWTVFENATNPPVNIITNPDQSGANTSATVAEFTALMDGQPWAGTESQHLVDLGEFSFDETNCTVKIMVWKPVISDVGIKFVEASGDAQPEIKVANTVTNQWEELTFDFSPQIGTGATGILDQIVVFPDFDLAGRTQDNVCYFDNITFSEQELGDVPTMAAPTPMLPAENVISLFSNPYTDVNVDTWSAEWDQADVTDIQIEGNDTKRYTNLVFAGIEFTSQTINAAEMTHFHMDIWTPDATAIPAVFKIKLVDFGADGVWSGGDDVEYELTFDANTMPGLVSEEWLSFDIPLADFTGLVTREHMAQLVISGDLSTVFVDNIYFHNYVSSTEENDIALAAQLGNNYPNPFNPETEINYLVKEAGHVSLKVYDAKGRLVETLTDAYKTPANYQVTWKADNAASGIYFYRLSVNGKAVDTKRMVLLK